ncbi:hypothetical protein [Embleya sp. NPDC020630]
MNDLLPGLLRPDIDPQLLATIDRLLDHEIEALADRIHRGTPR